MRESHDPDGLRLPIKLDTTTNGEFAPVPLEAVHHAANHRAFEAAGRNAKRLALERRGFLVSACGAATTLLAMNEAYAQRGFTGGFFDVPKEAALDVQLARATVEGSEFIFDVQGHFVNPTGAWTKRLPEGATPLRGMPKAGMCQGGKAPAGSTTSSASMPTSS